MSHKKGSLHQTIKLLEESEVRYKLLVEGVNDYAIFMLDPNGIIVSWNSGANRIKGYTAVEIIGKHFSTFYSKEDTNSGFPDYELEMAKKEGRFENEGWRIRKNGSMFWANVVITPIYDENKNLLGFSKVTRDLTEKKALEESILKQQEELLSNEQRYRLLIESVKDYGLFMLTPEGNIASWNIGAERMNGYKAQEIIGKHFSIFYAKEAVDEGFPNFELKKALAEGRFEDEGIRIKKDGSEFWVNVIIAPLFDLNNKHIGFSKITRDLTEQIRNEELTKKNRELLKINTDLDNFIYTASHDLNAPIANMQGILMSLMKKLDAKLNPDETQLLEMMGMSISKLKKTIIDLTEITKIQKDIESNIENLSFEEILKDVKNDLESPLQDLNAIIRIDLQIKEVKFARTNLRSIIYNLLSNAVKYRSLERPLNIKISTFTEKEFIVLSIKDNGLGLAKEQKERLFSLFKRFHTHVEGTGIGLYIVKRIIENNRGKIEVDTKLNKGTEFKVFFQNDPQ